MPKVGGPSALFAFQSGIKAGITYKGQLYNLQPGEKFFVRGGVGTTGPITPEDVRFFTSALSLGKSKAFANGEKSRRRGAEFKGSQTEAEIKNDAAANRNLERACRSNPTEPGGSTAGHRRSSTSPTSAPTTSAIWPTLRLGRWRYSALPAMRRRRSSLIQGRPSPTRLSARHTDLVR